MRSYLNAGGSALLRIRGKLEEAGRLLRRAIDIDEATVGINPRSTARDLGALASVHWALNDLVEAEVLYRRALEITKACDGTQESEFASHLANLWTGGLISCRFVVSDDAREAGRLPPRPTRPT